MVNTISVDLRITWFYFSLGAKTTTFPTNALCFDI